MVGWWNGFGPFLVLLENYEKNIQKSPGRREKASFWHGDSSCNVCLLHQ